MAGDSRNGRGPGNGNGRKVGIAKGPKNGKGFEEWQGVTGMAEGPRNDGIPGPPGGLRGGRWPQKWQGGSEQGCPKICRGSRSCKRPQEWQGVQEGWQVLDSREIRRVQVFSGFFTSYIFPRFFVDFSISLASYVFCCCDTVHMGEK